MVAHAVYREDMASLAGTASEDSPGSSVAIAGHAAGRMAAEGAAGSSGRPAVVVVAKSATHRGVVVAITRHWTVAVVHRRIVIVVVVAVAIAVPVAVAVAVPVAVAVVVPVAVAVVVPVSVVMVIVVVVVVDIIIVVVAMSHRRIVSMSFGRIGSVEVVSGIVACAPAAMATLEGHEHCGTVEEHPSDTIAGVDGEGPATSAPDDGTVEPLTGHEAVVLPGAEHKAQVAVANFPPESEHVGAGIYVEQVVEVDLIHCLIL